MQSPPETTAGERADDPGTGSRPAPLAYSIEQCCALTSLGRTSVFAAIRSGQLRVARIGRRTLVLASSLHELLGEQP